MIIKFPFIVDHLYSISEKVSGRISDDLINVPYGVGCIFKYVGKKGKHHYFVNIRGGWSRTYTDVQLIGKKIQEVNL